MTSIPRITLMFLAAALVMPAAQATMFTVTPSTISADFAPANSNYNNAALQSNSAQKRNRLAWQKEGLYK